MIYDTTKTTWHSYIDDVKKRLNQLHVTETV
jgi:hypothetical protein